MIYYLNENYHTAVLAKDNNEANTFALLFQTPGKIINVNDSKELYQEIFNYMRFTSNKILHAYRLINSNNQIAFLYFSHDTTNCRIIKDYFCVGEVIEDKTDLFKKKKSSNMTFAGPNALKKKLDSIKPEIMRNGVLTEASQVEESAKPQEMQITETIIELVNYNSSYENDNIFADAIQGAQMLKTNYNKAIQQKQELTSLVATCDKETLDILHDLELNFKWYDILNAYKTILKISHIRKQRRRAKDKLEIINVLEESLTLECLNKISEIPERLENREYRKRNNLGMFDFEGKFKKEK